VSLTQATRRERLLIRASVPVIAQALIHGLEVPQGKRVQAEHVFRREQGQGFSLSRSGFLDGQAHVIEEGGRVRVSGVHPVPEARKPARLQIAGNQRGLTGSGGSGYPQDRALAQVINGLEEAISRKDMRQGRAGNLGGDLHRVLYRPFVLQAADSRSGSEDIFSVSRSPKAADNIPNKRRNLRLRELRGAL
jgi:hypothetical protein